ncbi:hypothetical protein ACFFU1_02840 [Algibacter miyuki]|uniref:Uncharacterized protein n=1 Tax=Algibacter miyuki TaxID=1306933 RepID=A0ABV5GW05_9FLAO|nr:hypothetical protein [Algibacter miyuki]MDN3665151.1 hypothetical protein [Algibacter miyuki]
MKNTLRIVLLMALAFIAFEVLFTDFEISKSEQKIAISHHK